MPAPCQRSSGFTLVEIMIVVAIIGLLAAIALPNMAKSRETAQLNALYSNLRVIEGAKDRWALENKKGTGDVPPDLSAVAAYIRGGSIFNVVGETYEPNAIGAGATATIGVRLGTYSPGSVIPTPPF